MTPEHPAEVHLVAPDPPPPPRSRRVPLALASGTVVILALGTALFARARGDTNRVALASEPKHVTVVAAHAGTWRAEHRYVGTVEPWVGARVGPQFISAYVDTVLVRPGAMVKRGDIVATLDCRNASATSKAVAMQARALEASQAAIAKEAARMSTLLQGGYASPDEVEMKSADSSAKQAQLLAAQAQMLGASLQVQDCVLRAPFDGEVAERNADPGSFAHPGTPIATLIERDMVRLTAEVPEGDFEDVAPGTAVRIHLLATGKDLAGTIARRAPAADESTRTVHVEIDLPNADRSIPVGTTAELRLTGSASAPAAQIPLAAATVRADKASVAVVEKGVVHRRTLPVLGESGGDLFVAPQLEPGALVVLDGRGNVSDGEPVQATEAAATPVVSKRGT